MAFQIAGIPIEAFQAALWQILEQVIKVNPGEYVTKGGNVLRQVGETCIAAADACEDGVISIEEAKRVMDEAFDVIAAVQAFKQDEPA